MTKSGLLNLIKKLTTENGGDPPGAKAFYASTGVKESDWKNKQWNAWNNWGDVLEEAGFPRRSATTRLESEHVLTQLALLTRKNRHFPVTLDMRREKRQNPQFPNDKVISGAFGSRKAAFSALLNFCESRGEFSDVAPMLRSATLLVGFKSVSSNDCEGDEFEERDVSATPSRGFVYLIRTGRHYKLGFTTAPFHRFSTLIKQSPQGGEPIHHFATDDPRGIERYWQLRFETRKIKAENKLSGEFYELTPEDIAAFRRRKRFM